MVVVTLRKQNSVYILLVHRSNLIIYNAGSQWNFSLLFLRWLNAIPSSLLDQLFVLIQHSLMHDLMSDYDKTQLHKYLHIFEHHANCSCNLLTQLLQFESLPKKREKADIIANGFLVKNSSSVCSRKIIGIISHFSVSSYLTRFLAISMYLFSLQFFSSLHHSEMDWGWCSSGIYHRNT